MYTTDVLVFQNRWPSLAW